MNINDIKVKFIINGYKRDITALRTKNSELSIKLKNALNTNEDKISKQVNERVNIIDRLHKKELKDLRDNHNKELDEINSKHKEEVSELSKKVNELTLENKRMNKIFQDMEITIQLRVDKTVSDTITDITKEDKRRIKELEKENDNLTDKVDIQKKEIDRLKSEIEKKDYEIDKLNKQVGMNSTNSGIPTSKEMPFNSSRTNRYNHRKKSDKPSGGQVGHKGSTKTIDDVEELMKKHNITPNVQYVYVSGKKGTKEKYKIGLSFSVSIDKYVIVSDPSYSGELPLDLYSNVTYDNNLKVLITMLGNYCSLSYEKIYEIIDFISNGAIKLSQGTIDNIYNEIATKSKGTLDNIVENLKNSKYIHTDETTTSENGKSKYYRGYCNPSNVVYCYHGHKGDKPIKEDDILPNFLGTIISDHEPGIFKYGENNQDCTVHIGRYCNEGDQNIEETDWQIRFYRFILDITNKIKELKGNNINTFSEEEISCIEKEYDELLKMAENQNENIQSMYWKEKEVALLNRLTKFKKEILCFIRDFDVPSNNNLMERLLRMIKSKTKMSGGFRSENGGERFGVILSVIKTAKLRDMNPFDCISQILEGKDLFA